MVMCIQQRVGKKEVYLIDRQSSSSLPSPLVHSAFTDSFLCKIALYLSATQQTKETRKGFSKKFLGGIPKIKKKRSRERISA